MTNFNTKSLNVKAINIAVYREIDEIRVRVNVLSELLQGYRLAGLWLDPDDSILSAIREADDQLAEASMTLERLGAR